MIALCLFSPAFVIHLPLIFSISYPLPLSNSSQFRDRENFEPEDFWKLEGGLLLDSNPVIFEPRHLLQLLLTRNFVDINVLCSTPR